MDSLLIRGVGSGLSAVYSRLIQEHQSSVKFIDPIATILKLGILAFKPTGTKISLQSNALEIQSPTVFQGLNRWFSGDDRDQLFHLRIPLLYFRGLELGFVCHSFDINILHTFGRLAIEGLKILNTTYEISKHQGSMVRQVLDEYVKLLSREYSNEEFHTEISRIEKLPSLFTIYNEFLKHWTIQDLHVCELLFESIEHRSSPNIKSMMADAVDGFVKAKDLELDLIRPD